jgi:hypothetical protein
MRLPNFILLTCLALCAAACSTIKPATDGTNATPSASVPAPVEGYDWYFSQEGGEARLAYGVAESDDLRLGLDCGQGSGRLVLSAIAGPGAETEIRIESGGESARFAAISEPSQLHDGVFLTANARADEPVFKQFRRLGWLAMWQDGERHAYAPHVGSADSIERFFLHCS